MRTFVTFLIMTLSLNAWGDCPEFATALEAAMAKVTAREELKQKGIEATKEAPSAKASLFTAATQKQIDDATTAGSKWATKEAQTYKIKYKQESSDGVNNRTFMTMMETDKTLKPNVVYFDVENAVQKKLNDTLVGDKAMVDAINNSFLNKFLKNLDDYPELTAKIEGRYKDYKSLRLRIKAGDAGDQANIDAMLNNVYEKTNKQFVAEFEKDGLTKLITPRTDEVPDVSTWFLSGTGDTALEANMAARAARTHGYKMGNAKTVNFEQHIDSIFSDVSEIENVRLKLARNKDLFKAGIMRATEDGTVIPTKDMIAILRKIKPADCESAAEYAMKIRAKVKTAFNSDISDANIDSLTTYFQKVDSLSPPLFARERVNIDLGEAKAGIVSVDFTGVGVDNAYQQMRALSTVNYTETDKLKLIKNSFENIQARVDEVTTEMNKAKRTFTLASKDVANPKLAPKFSGDDGILMPKLNWGQQKKVDLVQGLSKTEDPSKYRITFVKTELPTGAILPVAERSTRVVRAETVEKYIRESVVGAGASKISSEKSKKMIFAIDYVPDTKGGTFNLIVGGAKTTEEEKRVINEAFKRALSAKDEEKPGLLIDAS